MSRNKSKYGARKTICKQEHNHPSALEAAVCDLLFQKQKRGLLEVLKVQPRVVLGTGALKKTIIPDWLIAQSGTEFYVEAKGCWDARSVKNKKVWKELGPAPLIIYGGSWQRPMVTETVTPIVNPTISKTPHCGTCTCAV